MIGRPRSTLRLRFNRKCVWLAILIACVSFATILSCPAWAQTCSERDPVGALMVLNRYYRICSAPDAQDLVIQQREKLSDWRSAAIAAGPDAIPVLRKIAALPESYCFSTVVERRLVPVALARLGDENTYDEMKAKLKKESPSPYLGSLPLFAEVGDDWAVFTLVEYLIQHANDSALYTPYGPSDGPYDGRDNLLIDIQNMGRLRYIPDLPAADYSPAGIVLWKAWLEKHKGQHFSPRVSDGISDPYLQCLARKAEWGFPDAMLDIANFGGQSARVVLSQFPTPPPGQPMGVRDFSAEVGRQEGGVGDPYRRAQGNLETGLALLGDEKMLAQIASELEGYPYHWDYAPLEALRKLKYISGKPAVGVLVDALGNLKGIEQEAQKNLDQCTKPFASQHPTPERQEYIRRLCDHDRYFSYVTNTNALILKVLSQMVQNPPLPENASATAENFETWKDWWAKNKDQAVFVSQRPLQPLE